MKRVISLILSVLMVLSVCVFSVGVSATEATDELYAAVVSFDNADKKGVDNQDLDKIITSTAGTLDATLRGAEGGARSFVEYTYHDDKLNADIKAYYTQISGEGKYSVQIDASGVNFRERTINSIVLDADVDIAKLSVLPVISGTKGGVIADEAQAVSYNGYGYYKFPSSYELDGIVITVKEAGYSFNLREVFFCENDYSAKYIVDNNVLPSAAEPKKLTIFEGETSKAIDIAGLSNDVLYHDYNNVKWPSIVVDENDKTYVVAAGCRRASHPDLFASIIMATSDDKGETFNTPTRVFNSLMDDGDPGLTYLGNGKLLVSTYTGDGVSYLPGGANEYFIKNKNYDGGCDLGDAPKWDENGYPVGGALGNYVSLTQYIHDSDPDYNMNHRSYIIRSADYGETWDTTLYKLKGTLGVDYDATILETLENNEVNELTTGVPVSSAHGPTLLEDGTLCWVGKVFDPVDVEENLIATYVSYDEGDNWELRGMVPIPVDYSKGDFHEPDVTETKDGVLLCGIRSFDTFTCFSYDQGATWTTPQEAHLEGHPPAFTTMPNGDIVCVTGWRYDYANQRIYAYVSEDGGRTWSTRAQLSAKFAYCDDMGYPDSAYYSDGTLITAYYGSGDGIGYTYIRTTKWTYKTTVYYGDIPNTWIEDGNGWYYVNSDGTVAKNSWVQDAKGWRYVGADGYMVRSQGVKDKKGYYVVGDDGYRVTKAGWYKTGGNWFYVQKSGYLKVNGWMKDSKGWCYLSSKGIMQQNRVVKDSTGYCLLDASGYWVTKQGWHKANGDWYYVQKGGYLKTNGWMKDSKGWCFLNNEGTMQTAKSIKDSKGWCLVDASGYWVTKTGWQKAGDNWYYVQKGGYLKTKGWMKDSKGWCYLDETGLMLKNMAVKDSKGWVILDSTGYWLKTPGTYLVNFSQDGGLSTDFYDVGSDGYIIID